MNPGEATVPVPIAWHRTWDTADEHERIARTHRSQADALQVEYEQACGTSGADRVTVSPLTRYGIGATTTSAGSVVYIDRRAGRPDQFVADLRCHRAWMMLAPSGMDDCPLDLPGLLVDAKGDSQGITLTLSVRDPKWIPELQRRVAVELEARARTRTR